MALELHRLQQLLQTEIMEAIQCFLQSPLQVAEAVDVDERAAARKVQAFERCTFCVTAGHTYLVDRPAGVWYRLGEQRHPEGAYLVLVAMYARVCGMVPELCGIAINSAKLAGV